MFLMTLRDLQYRARRIALVTVLVALVMTLLYLMTGLAHQLQTEPGEALDRIGADHWVLQDGTRGPFTAISVLPLDLAERLPADARPVVAIRATATDPGGGERSEVHVIGHVPGELGQPRLTEGSAIRGPGEVVADERLGVAVGDTTVINAVEYTVVGLTERSTVLAGQPLVFVDLGVGQELAFQNDRVVTAFLTTGEAPQGLPGAVAISADDVADETLGPIEDAVASIDLVRVLLWFVAAIVMGAVVYLTALERQRDFAILKAVGSSGASLGGGLAIQAVLVAVVASLVGAIVARLIQPLFPLPVRIPGSALVWIPVVALVVGLVAALGGVRRVNRTDPAEAFS